MEHSASEARGSALNHSLLGEAACVSEPATCRQGGAEGGKEVGSDQGLLPALKEGPFVDEPLARAAWLFKEQPPCSSKPTTADDKASAANYPADGESLKWGCQSEGWSLCLQWDKIQERGLKEVRIQFSFYPFHQKSQQMYLYFQNEETLFTCKCFIHRTDCFIFVIIPVTRL